MKEKDTRAAAISEKMRRVKSGNTTPELRLRSALWKKGLRYRVAPADAPGKPDLYCPAHKLVIFVDGDYWHGNQWRRRGLACLEEQFGRSHNPAYWLKKIRGNMRRDLRVTAEWLARGWRVLRLWESDIESDLETCVQTAMAAVQTPPADTFNAAVWADQSVAEFFAGMGLMRLGLESDGWNTRFANDIDKRKRDIYESHFGAEGILRLEDVHRLDPNDVPTTTLATASFPCTDLSLAGSRQGLDGKQSSAFWGFIKVLKGMRDRRPPLVLLENVDGFLTSDGGNDFCQALAALNNLGYEVDAFQINASHFVPQSRPRLFVVGVQGGESEGYFEDASIIEPDHLRDSRLTAFIRAHTMIHWRIRPAPPLPTCDQPLSAVLDDPTQDDPIWWSRERASYLLSQMADSHREIADRMIHADGWSYGSVFRRIRHGKSTAELRTDGIAGCLRTPKGGSARQILFKAGFGEYHVRLLTGRECARLMGADDFTLNVSESQALFALGDAVCAPVVTWISKYILRPILNESIRGLVLVSDQR
jgi:DNA (cytosine-5)-methyltransferase 1